MFHVFDANLVCPLGGFHSAVARCIRPLGEQQKPHRIVVLLAVGRGVLHSQLAEAVRHAGLIDRHLPRHEDEAEEHHTRPHDRDILERFFQDDVKVAMHLGVVRIACPPKVKPVRVYLESQSALSFLSCLLGCREIGTGQPRGGLT